MSDEDLCQFSQEWWEKEIERLTAENKQFRAALEEIEENATSEFREALAALEETTE